MLKKLVVPLAVVFVFLGACSTEVSQENTDTTVAGPDEIMKQISENTEEDVRSSVALDFNTGVEWTEEGYTAYPAEDGTYTVTGYIEGTDKLFLVQNNEVVEEIPLSNTLDFEYTLDSLSETQVFYLVADNRLVVGQTDIDLEETDRAEKVTFAVE